MALDYLTRIEVPLPRGGVRLVLECKLCGGRSVEERSQPTEYHTSTCPIERQQAELYDLAGS